MFHEDVENTPITNNDAMTVSQMTPGYLFHGDSVEKTRSTNITCDRNLDDSGHELKFNTQRSSTSEL